MVETVLQFRRGASDFAVLDVRHRATRDQPHDQLNAFAAGFAHVVDVRNGRSSQRIGNQLVQEHLVKVFVDQACARALQLVTHATRAPNLYVQIFVVALHRFADGLAQVEATLAAGHGVLSSHGPRPSC